MRYAGPQFPTRRAERRSLRRAGLWLCAGLAVAGAAAAEDAGGADGPAAGVQLDEVVVTATRQATPLAKAPVSVSAFPAARLEALNIRTPEDLVRFVPGARFNPLDNSISFRGVQSDAGAATTGIYIDDTPVQIRALGDYPTNPEPVVFDLERVELIRGPQGALFGAGAEGGVVRFITSAPAFDGVHGRLETHAEATSGGGPSFEAGGAVNLPLAENRLALRVSAWLRHEGGYVDRVDWRDGHLIDGFSNRADTAVGRVALRWVASDRLTVTSSLNLQSRKAHDTSGWWEGRSDPAAGLFQNANPVRLSEDDRFILAAVKAEYDAGSVRLISNTSWFGRRQEGFYDASIYNLSWLQHFTHRPLIGATRLNLPIGSYRAPGAIINLQGDFAQEIRAQSADPDARLTWTAGAFFGMNRQENRDEEIDPQLDEISLALFGQDATQLYGYPLLANGDSYIGVNIAHDRQIAGFGQLDWRAMEALKLTVGLRVAATRFDFTNVQDGPYNAPGPSSAQGRQSETPVTPKLGVAYDLPGGSLLYATAAKGYRIGGANASLPLAFCGKDLGRLGLAVSPVVYTSDSVWSYEAGAKLRGLNGRLKLDASVFHLDWRNIQQNVYLPGCGFTFTANLGQATSRGFDLDGTLRLGDHWVAGLALGYASARYTSDSSASPNPADPAVVRAGGALPGAPWKLAGSLAYENELMGRPAFARIDYEYSSRERPGPVQDAQTQQYDAAIPAGPAVSYLQLRAGMDFGGWRLSAYVDNALDAHPETSRSHEDQRTRLFIGTTLRPRTIGLASEVSF